MSLSVSEFELLNFFETIPIRHDPGIPWAYDDSVYEFDDGQFQISFGITPCSRDVSVVLRAAGALLYELHAQSVEEVKLQNDKGRDSLEVMASQRNRMRIAIKPNISIMQWFSGPEF